MSLQRIFNLLHYIGMIREELTFDDTVSYTTAGKMDCNTAKCYGSDKIRTADPRVTNPMP